MSTIYYMIERSLHIKDRLNLNSVVCVYDQAIYAKPYQITYKEHDKFQDHSLMIGTFHIILTFLAVIASRFKGAGLGDVLIQSNIVAEGSMDTIFSGSHAYKRAIRIYKIMYESFFRIPFDDFELACTSECNGILQLLDDINESYNFNELLESNKMNKVIETTVNKDTKIMEGLQVR